MACFKPREVWQYLEKGVAVGRPLFTKPTDRLTEEKKIPCQSCIGCRIDYTSDWQGRMLLEASLHEDNEFWTLTYDEENLPPTWDLVYSDVQKFLKRVRKAKGKIRFALCGEYGDENSRPHWHIIVFGSPKWNDLETAGRGSMGDSLYRSEELETLWGKGNVMIGEVNETTCAYVAKYQLKDTGARDERNYEWMVPETGEIIKRRKPFFRTSRNPGIASDWFDVLGMTDVFPKGFYHDRTGRVYRAPKYFMEKLKTIDPELYERLKKERKDTLTTDSFVKNNTLPRLKTRNQLKAIDAQRANNERKIRELAR